MRNLVPGFVCLACLAMFIARCERVVTLASPTFDEAVHLTAGYSYWKTGDFRINRETPPLMKLVWALPLVLGDRPPFEPDAGQWEGNKIWLMADAFLYESPVPPMEMLKPARRMNVAIGALFVVLVGWWAFRLWGPIAAMAGWALPALDPNLIAQSSLLSTDVGIALFTMASAYCFWEYVGNPRRPWLVLASVALGLALSSKYSAVISVAGVGTAAIFFVLAGGSFALPGVVPGIDRRARLKQLAPAFVRIGLIATLAILPAYFLIHALDWPRGLRQQLGRHEFEEPHYFLNREISSKGWLWYFPEVIALKTPAGTLVLVLISLCSVWKLPRRTVAFLIFPATIYFMALVATRLNIGIRVILPAYALLWLLAARVASLGEKPISRWLFRMAVLAGIVVPPIVDADVNGRDLAYFNGVYSSRSQGFRYLGDSNIDWGQGLMALSVELRERGNPVIYLAYFGTARPDAFGIRYERLPGFGELRPSPADRVDPAGRVYLAIGIGVMQGTYLDKPTSYYWLSEREPISRTDGSIWLYDLTEDEPARRKLKEIAKAHRQ